jgi:hypothetical protein
MAGRGGIWDGTLGTSSSISAAVTVRKCSLEREGASAFCAATHPSGRLPYVDAGEPGPLLLDTAMDGLISEVNLGEAPGSVGCEPRRRAVGRESIPQPAW